jgi:hypothetical protein
MAHTFISSWLSRTLAIADARSGWSWTTRIRIGEIEDGFKDARVLAMRMAGETDLTP